MVKSVHKIFSYYKKHGYQIIVIRMVKSVHKIFRYYKNHSYSNLPLSVDLVSVAVTVSCPLTLGRVTALARQLEKLSLGARSDQSI